MIKEMQREGWWWRYHDAAGKKELFERTDQVLRRKLKKFINVYVSESRMRKAFLE